MILLRVLGVSASLLLLFLVFIDGFETILLPRRVTHRFRFARLYYRNAWKLWRLVASLLPTRRIREAFLGVFGPLSLLGLFSMWVAGLITGFALLHFSVGSPVHQADTSLGFWDYVYLSGTTFFTLGYGDLTPTAPFGRALAVIESGLGFGFLAVIVGYLPVLQQAFSRREAAISMLDARAGSPPHGSEFLLRMARTNRLGDVDVILREWELWCAELLEGSLSFPVLAYYRSQHDNQSWLAALATILDSCAILLTQVQAGNTYQAQLTFAMARHAAVDLTLVLRTRPSPKFEARLTPEQQTELRAALQAAGVELRDDPEGVCRLSELRELYEPFLDALAQRFVFVLPNVMPRESVVDNWQTSAWMRRTPGFGHLPGATQDDHFD